MGAIDDSYEFTQPTQPTQPIEDLTQAPDDDPESSNQNVKPVGTLVKITGNIAQDFNLFLNVPILIGRHRTSDIIVNSTFSSNRHCKITALESTAADGFIVVCEDHSSNGTLWNGKNIGKGNKVLLTHGDTLEIKRGNYFTYLQKNRSSNKSDEDLELNINSVYQITDKVLGSGTFAKVNLAIRKDTQTQVAVKIMKKKDRLNPGSMGGGTNYIDEINLLRAFDHPNIMRVTDVIETEKKVYVFMPLVSGGDLFDQIIKSGSLFEEESKFITYQMLLALKYLHDRNISHRDVKPENILMDSKDSFSIAMLSDFGMARTTDPNNRMQTICGTFQYIAPEIIKSGMDKNPTNKPGYSMAVDCWSLGIVVYAMLSGTCPNSLLLQHSYKYFYHNPLKSF
ncbi:Meiosis-specific serine/threonine-protein kinase mek1 [Smittium culicis]|uniref:Meiosis-specific serine/threonine-protein kinase mek1 n=1 Tax=Smittium culicis TaxID=133412 RepID=A0A1R1X4H9_9FUNG|nr:Meiosis-specific serine/threonine-protein kinase mek1 [Smittium culicis]